MAVRRVLGPENLDIGCLASLRSRIKPQITLVVFRVAVNRRLAGQEAINATGHRQYIDKDVVNSMPKGSGNETEIFFFKLGYFVNDADLDNEYELQILNPADPYLLAAFNEANPSFADQRPNVTHWKDSNGKWCYTAFDRWRGERRVYVGHDVSGWDGFWWFAGVRK